MAEKKTSGRRAPADSGDPVREIDKQSAEEQGATPARDVRRGGPESTPTEYQKGGWMFAAVIIGLMVLAILAATLVN